MSYTTKNYLWEAVASYVVNDYFTYIYSAAKTSTRNISLTEAYQTKVEIYVRGCKSVDENYRRLCSDLHRFITRGNRFTSLMYGEFVDRMIESCTPSEYYKVLTKDHKDELFSSIINDLIAGMGAFCTKSSMLRKIIDEHDKSKDVTQDIIFREALQILSIKKENLTHSFISSIGQVKETVPIEVVHSYKEQIDKLNIENKNLNSIISDLENENDKITDDFNVKEQKYRRLIDYLQKNRITIEKTKTIDRASIDVQTEPPPTMPNKLTEDNLKKHLQDPKNKPPIIASTMLKDESDSSSNDIVETHRNSYKKSLDSGKNEVSDVIEGLLLVDQHSDP